MLCDTITVLVRGAKNQIAKIESKSSQLSNLIDLVLLLEVVLAHKVL